MLKRGLSAEDVDEVIIEEKLKECIHGLPATCDLFPSKFTLYRSKSNLAYAVDTKSAAAPAEALAKTYINKIASALRSQSELSDSMATFLFCPQFLALCKKIE